MASNKYSLIDIQNDDQEIDLQFQDFERPKEKSKVSESNQTNFAIYSDSYGDDDDQQRLLDDEQATAEPRKATFLSFQYYQQFFNVESKQVGDRIFWSMVPKPGVNYLHSYIRPNPDLYGPFWICVTLVFTSAVAGNLANYLQTPDTYKWRYDFHKVTFATSIIFSYAWMIPLLIWSALKWRDSKATISLLEIICLYGYSLAVFVPVTILWMFGLKWLQWCLGIVASVLSGSVLVRTILPSISNEAKKLAFVISVVILVLHAIFALGFMLYFFYPHSTSGTLIHNNSTEKVVSTTIESSLLKQNFNVVGSPLKRSDENSKVPRDVNSEDKVNKQLLQKPNGNSKVHLPSQNIKENSIISKQVTKNIKVDSKDTTSKEVMNENNIKNSISDQVTNENVKVNRQNSISSDVSNENSKVNINVTNGKQVKKNLLQNGEKQNKIKDNKNELEQSNKVVNDIISGEVDKKSSYNVTSSKT